MTVRSTPTTEQRVAARSGLAVHALFALMVTLLIVPRTIDRLGARASGANVIDVVLLGIVGLVWVLLAVASVMYRRGRL